MSPHAVITDVVFEAFLQCEMKAYLLLQGVTGTDPEIADWQWTVAHQFQTSCSERLRRITPEAQCHTGMPPLDALKQGVYRVILDPLISISDIHTQLHALVRMATSRSADGVSYSPVRFVPHEKLASFDKLIVAFDALVLSRVTGHKPRVGKIVHGSRYVSATVPLSRLSGKAQSSLTRLAALRGNATPPPLVLNKHCPACQFRSRCRQSALEKDDLSLLANVSEKDRRKLNSKGIFTITQLSYTFRPRRYSFRKNSRSLRHDPALKALAIRKNQIHVIGTPMFSVPKNAVYLDIEGVPDRNFYYLIGLRYKSDDAWVQRSFWADTESDEKQTWASFLQALALLGNPQLVHYGSYETQFLKRMKTRYADVGAGDFVDGLILSSLNLLSLIYAQVYFPTYSNGLKEVAQHLGFRWSNSDASGLHAIVWRSEWESSHEPSLKKTLTTYNAEDCQAAQRVAETLAAICSEQPSPMARDGVSANVNSLEHKSLPKFGRLRYALPDFKVINEAAYWDYQRSRVYVRSTSRPKDRRKKGVQRRRTRPTISIIHEPIPDRCPQCGTNLIYKHDRRRNVVCDLRFSSTGVRRRLHEFHYSRYRCRTCGKTFTTFSAPKIGRSLRSYIIYQLIQQRISQRSLPDNLYELFGIVLTSHQIHRIKTYAASEYQQTYRNILQRIATGTLVHADETQVNVRGSAAYVWVFTSLVDVAYVFSESRNASTVQEVLEGFEGVLVSDFYSAYEAVSCLHQKCLIHLMRDINEDVLRNPFNEEVQGLAHEFANLVKPIVETIDRFGLKSYYLRKHKKKVIDFYNFISNQRFISEVAIGYVRRFDKNIDKLFTFLDHDGVPWNNNNAEHAVKSFALLRNAIGSTSSLKGIREYTVLLSVCETCKVRGISFLDFLRSGEVDINSYIARK